MNNYPKILFITPCAFSKETGGGITFTNLFKNWPVDKIATIHSDNINLDFTVCNKYYALSSKEIRYFGLKKYKSEVKINKTTDNNLTRTTYNFIYKMKYFLFGDALPNRGILSKELIYFIDNYKPDIIYTIIGTSYIMDIVNKVSQLYKIPITIHIMDDWINANYNKGLLFFIEKYRIKNKFKALIQKSKNLIAISEEMKLHYEKIYNKKFYVFQNTVDIDNFKREISNLNIIPKIIYFGSIFKYSQSESLKSICKAILNLNNNHFHVNLEIYTNKHHSYLLSDYFNTKYITFHNLITNDYEYFNTLNSANILVLPTNFDSNSIKHIGLSMPTKLPSYLISGTPILIIGSTQTAQVNYADKYKFAHIVNEDSIQKIMCSIKLLITNTEYSTNLVKNAYKTATRNHDQKIVRNEFQNLFINSFNI